MDDLAHQGVLHRDAGQFANVSGRRLVVLVREAMRVGIVGRVEA